MLTMKVERYVVSWLTNARDLGLSLPSGSLPLRPRPTQAETVHCPACRKSSVQGILDMASSIGRNAMTPHSASLSAFPARWAILLLVALLPSWAVSQDEPNSVNAALSTQIITMALPENVQAEVRVAEVAASSGKTVALGTPTDRPNQSSRSGAAAIGVVYAANPELHEVIPGDFVSFEALNGDTYGFEVTKSRVTRHGNVEITAREDGISLFAVVTETGDFFADVLIGSQTYRAFISEDQTIVFSSDDPEISKGTVANDTPFEDLNDLSSQYTAAARSAQPLTPRTGSNTVIALGILLDDYFWANQGVALARIDYYVANLNSAYQQAGADIRFEVSKIGNYEPYKDAYATSGSLSPTLNWITCGSTDCQPTSGVNTAVDNWRIANKLDVVTQFLRYAAVTTPNAQGQYFINWGIAQLPFSNVAITIPSILKQYTYSVAGLYNPYNGVSAGAYLLAHEIGHNFGLWHDRETLEGQLNDSWANLQPVLATIMRYPYGIGYRFGQSSGTTMSYAPNNVNLLSTPNVLSGGIPIGVPIGQSSQAFSAQAVSNVMSYYKAVFNNAPSAPSITKVEGEDEQILVTFASGATGGLAVTGYTATCTDGQNSFQGTGTSSPIAVKGVSNDVAYTCTVIATNPDGASAPSGSSGSVTPEDSAGGLPIWLLYEATK